MDSGMKFADAKSLGEAVRILKKAGVAHPRYCHYTTLGALKKIFRYKTFRLTLGNSYSLDDNQEYEKYGSQERWGKTYIGCFSYAQAESAALWGLYCSPECNAIRIRFSKDAMLKWVKSLKAFSCVRGKKGSEVEIFPPLFSDVAYACVPFDENDPKKRTNKVFHNTECTHEIIGLCKQKRDAAVTGFVKDYEWRFENESRLLIRTKEPQGKHLLISLPDEVLADMRFTLSPWVNDEERDSIQDTITNLFKAAGIKRSKKGMFTKSALEGGLKKWAKRCKLCMREKSKEKNT